MTQGKLTVEWVSLDDLYHPETLEHYDPECCCAYCFDVSLAKERAELAAMYRSMRKESTRMARLTWQAMKRRDAILKDAISESLFYSDPHPNQIGGLQALLAD